MRREILASLAAVLAGSGLVLAGPWGNSQPQMSGTQGGQVISSQVISSEVVNEDKGWRPGALIRRMRDKNTHGHSNQMHSAHPVMMHQSGTPVSSGAVMMKPGTTVVGTPQIVSPTSSTPSWNENQGEEKKGPIGRLMSRMRKEKEEQQEVPTYTSPSKGNPTMIQTIPGAVRPMPNSTVAEPQGPVR